MCHISVKYLLNLSHDPKMEPIPNTINLEAISKLEMARMEPEASLLVVKCSENREKNKTKQK